MIHCNLFNESVSSHNIVFTGSGKYDCANGYANVLDSWASFFVCKSNWISPCT